MLATDNNGVAVIYPLSGPTTPTPRFIGDTWWDTTNGLMKVHPGTYTAGVPDWNASSGVILFNDQTLGADTATISIASIPAGYKNIRITVQGRVSGAVVNGTLGILLNGDASNAYDWTYVQNNNATLSGNTAAANAYAFVGYLPGTSVTRGSTAGSYTIMIPNYAGTVFEKSITSNGGMVDSTAGNVFKIDAQLSWRNTAAINAVTVMLASGTKLLAGTRATTYLDN